MSGGCFHLETLAFENRGQEFRFRLLGEQFRRVYLHVDAMRKDILSARWTGFERLLNVDAAGEKRRKWSAHLLSVDFLKYSVNVERNAESTEQS